MACTYMYRYKAWCMVYQNKSTLLYKLKEQNGKKKEKKNKKKDQK